MTTQKKQNLMRDKKVLTNDFILMEYSRNMTIIENEYKRIKEQKTQRAAIAAQQKPTNNNNMKRPTKTKNLSQVMQVPSRLLLEKRVEMLQNQHQLEDFGKLKLRQTQTDIPNTQTLPEILDLHQINPQISQDPSYSNLDNLPRNIKAFSQGGGGEIQAMAAQLTKPIRSESMAVPSSYLDAAREDNKLPSHFADLDRAMEGTEGSQSGKREFDGSNTPKTGPSAGDKKKVIHRRIIYFNKQSNIGVDL